MRNYILGALCLLFVLVGCENKRQGPPKLLVFSKTMAFKHASIPAGIAALEKLGQENNFVIDTTTNGELFTDENLAQYSAVVFLSTTGNVLNAKEEAAFERYIQAGGGYVGIHAAADTEYDWGWYNKLAGAQFLSHPAGTPEADFIIKDKNHPSTEFFTETVWHRTDELYNYKNIYDGINVLVTVDESTYEGGENGENHPMAWYHDFDGGRAFYTAAGHTDESYSEELFLKHVLGGINYAIGKNLELDYAKAKSQIPPEADRFSKVVLSTGQFFEPTEMTVLPNNDVLIAQRRGEVMLYSDETKEISQVAFLDVYHKTLETPGVNAEQGLMGLQKDPNFSENNWIYLYYAPTGDKWVNRLSRFKYTDGNFDMTTEQVILELDSQREICCHTGGSITFGPDGLLYLSTGDNSTPFNDSDVKYVNNGYAPLNDMPGKENFDARRTSGNTNDLRGKILRIKVNEDGSYDIPEGNLFPVGTEKTRPEIYTMGHRNPYRISVDMKRGYLYWGDVGPDARVDSLATRGPQGYDEMNQARGPGNFGWPMFIGDNFAYHKYDYETGESGRAFNPEKPINDSKNNTGLTELPPAQPAYVYYHYGDIQDFPQVGAGSRNAMAGPTYWSDMYSNGGGLPSYYDGKVIIYDWMRGWMMAVHLFEDGTFNKMEPFAPEVELHNLIDMEMSPDGRVYLLEYGSGWFSANPDSGLAYIEYNGGNRPPVIDSFTVDANSGSLPLSVTATVESHDREGDSMSYVWDLGDGTTQETSEPTLTYTYDKAGAYKLNVTVKDPAGEEVTSIDQTIVAGNERPVVNIEMGQTNSSFYIPGQPINYKVSVTDADSEVNEDNVYISVEYRSGMDEVNQSLGHQQVSGAVMGKALTQSLDCKSCHKEKEASIGPNYYAVSEKYKGDRRSTNYLMAKIIAGGSGVWGEVVMPAHPNVTQMEARQITQYIQSLTGGNRAPSLPMSGSVTPEAKENGEVFLLTASYTDEGTGEALPLTGSETVVLPSNSMSFPDGTPTEGMQAMTFGGMQLQLLNAANGWLKIENTDLTGVSRLMAIVAWQSPPAIGYTMELRSGSPDGEVLGTGKLNPNGLRGQGGAIVIPIKKTDGVQPELYLTYKAEGEGASPFAMTQVQFN
ncbi:ThuA domain-containing protein [Flagellimonas zhangzhouensis]|uniref:Glucose/arabinose dehydrogenase, beta-propeller fold n=1 Tax=Flagellimonas zhangzhouensis TaxID=1073328 RepID=A0A1H2RM17_9FLAO|nr:ThuA domain-containing protein [Allomuricauda zhangzhouensis]SDQ65514.1 Glucose/arabinose dehydrogenase, beta-propeller fold [Allomuricauda zhangzhouensis]SDW20506.1 Glucose/arabinose dehydrogenase, beta-propeller fold [Allomuricauda zhangzhouensis]